MISRHYPFLRERMAFVDRHGAEMVWLRRDGAICAIVLFGLALWLKLYPTTEVLAPVVAVAAITAAIAVLAELVYDALMLPLNSFIDEV